MREIYGSQGRQRGPSLEVDRGAIRQFSFIGEDVRRATPSGSVRSGRGKFVASDRRHLTRRSPEPGFMGIACGRGRLTGSRPIVDLIVTEISFIW